MQPLLYSVNGQFKLRVTEFLVLDPAFGYKMCCMVKVLNHSNLVYSRSDDFLHIFMKQYSLHSYVINPRFVFFPM